MTDDRDRPTVQERVTLAGSELVGYAKGLIADGYVRRLVIRKPSGKPLLEVPLLAGVAVGGALLALAPFLAALGAIAALVSKVEVDIERLDQDPEERAKLKQDKST